MENSMLLAKIFGSYFIIIALGGLFNLKNYQKVLDDFCKSSALIYLGGIFALVFGLLVLVFHNVWVANWTVIITILGWGALIKGAWLIIFPNTVAKFTQGYQKKTTLLTLHLVIALALGIFLIAKGCGLVSCPLAR
ncbi:MAG: hypothetical protein KKH29_02425 [Candidatus Omnitrophica bacterium]|nr:hypothetical protein [Candidatus Omnitrophota bacterium]MBU4473553.1 hypothetical protein [Candidatus Omnitrophota bacterium]